VHDVRLRIGRGRAHRTRGGRRDLRAGVRGDAGRVRRELLRFPPVALRGPDPGRTPRVWTLIDVDRSRGLEWERDEARRSRRRLRCGVAAGRHLLFRPGRRGAAPARPSDQRRVLRRRCTHLRRRRRHVRGLPRLRRPGHAPARRCGASGRLYPSESRYDLRAPAARRGVGRRAFRSVPDARWIRAGGVRPLRRPRPRCPVLRSGRSRGNGRRDQLRRDAIALRRLELPEARGLRAAPDQPFGRQRGATPRRHTCILRPRGTGRRERTRHPCSDDASVETAAPLERSRGTTAVRSAGARR
jgi:hypothetical protein